MERGKPTARDDAMNDADHQADERYMQLALHEALAALDADEVPIGCVVARDHAVIGRGYNQRKTLNDPTAHAEMIAITSAAAAVGDWRLNECTLYVTLEPCTMCAGAIVLARIPRVVYGASDPKGGACGTLYNILDDARLNHRAEVIGGVLGDECGQILTHFFEQQRSLGKK